MDIARRLTLRRHQGSECAPGQGSIMHPVLRASCMQAASARMHSHALCVSTCRVERSESTRRTGNGVDCRAAGQLCVFAVIVSTCVNWRPSGRELHRSRSRNRGRSAFVRGEVRSRTGPRLRNVATRRGWARRGHSLHGIRRRPGRALVRQRRRTPVDTSRRERDNRAAADI